MEITKDQKIFLSYAFNGHDPKIVVPRMKRLSSQLRESGYEVYLNLEDKRTEKFISPGDYAVDSLIRLKECDVLVVVKASQSHSEGMLIEIGAAMSAGMPIYLILHTSARGATYLDDPLISKSTLTWESEEELDDALKTLTQ